ncbi:hypothetical protein AVDCRST_MAG81-2070 [uncultured Synechococcales cyanobacterium]|uniref:Uncharacterized protein n=1 Tax=uncultured Synechococcales cyanobacterium TaxID=1936017 RepID=A0A6J4VDQ8_9CYAN|nr:hypothetical protein AVDCRST_MAG81-2070 [uncultured Synechococcales cyanobacterium]
MTQKTSGSLRSQSTNRLKAGLLLPWLGFNQKASKLATSALSSPIS